MLRLRISSAVFQPRFTATRSAARCARRWMLWSLLMFPFSSKRQIAAWRWGTFPLDFHVQVNHVFAVCQIGRTGTDFPVLTGNHLFVELFDELAPELLPVLNVIETGMLRRWNQHYSDNGILYRPMLGKGQMHEFHIPIASSSGGNRLSNTRYIFPDASCVLIRQ